MEAGASNDEQNHLDRRAAGLSMVAGTVVVIFGTAIGGFDRTVIAAAVINVGTALGLLAFLVVIERRLFTRVTTAARAIATEAARQETEGLRDRIVRLEELDAAQSEARRRRHHEAVRAAEALTTEGLTHKVIAEVLRDADARNLFGPAFCLRTSPDPRAPLLYLLPLLAAGEARLIYLDFEPFEAGPDQIIGEAIVPAPRRRPTTTVWIHDEDAADIAGQLEARLERQNIPSCGFSLAHALGNLRSSIAVAVGARAAAADDGERLRGSLDLLVNEHWCATTYGLESTSTRAAFRLAPGGFDLGGMLRDPQLEELPAMPSEEPGLEEAVSFLHERWGWLRPDDPQRAERILALRECEEVEEVAGRVRDLRHPRDA